MIEILQTFSSACHFQLRTHCDQRGTFTKLFQASVFAQHKWPGEWREQYVSVSHPGVLRGLHFQTPPHEHDKVVIALSGTVLDAAVDLRRQSPTYGHHQLFSLSAHQGVFIPRGFAHGFFVIGDQPATLLYLTTSEHAPQHDSGILWNSLDIAWPQKQVVLSQRDQSFIKFVDFDSPF